MLNKSYKIPFSGSIYLHYAKDCAEQFLLALESNQKGCNIFNVTGEMVAISDFKKILNETISNDSIIDQDLGNDFPIPSDIDISKNIKAFNLPELTSFSDGINETINYLKYGIQNNLLPSSFIDG
jgi:nucleoside-diphosphate-sugar epimerase